jgi:hypothetical protein
MHQLLQNVSPRRLVVEIHAEWGLQRSFFADVRRIRELYEVPLSCRVTLVTIWRHLVVWFISHWNWRAADAIPLCQYMPARDGLSRQLTGHRLCYLANPDEEEIRLGGAPLAALRHFDVVGLTELFDESLLLLARKAGLRHLGYAKLAENAREDIPRLVHAVASQIMAAASGLASADPLILTDGEGRTTLSGGDSDLPHAYSNRTGAALGDEEAFRQRLSLHAGSVRAMHRLALESKRQVEARVVLRGAENAKAACAFHPCDTKLHVANGVWNSSFCDGVDGAALIRRMLDRTSTDRLVHAAVLLRLRRDLAAEGLVKRDLKLKMERLGRAKKRVVEWRERDMSGEAVSLCGTLKCTKDLVRSCVGCRFNVVPPVEGCWPPWEDQFSPDERAYYCKRSWTRYPAFDAAEIEFQHWPKVAPIPCWQTCWEAMTADRAASHGVAPTCFPTNPDVAFANATCAPGAAHACASDARVGGAAATARSLRCSAPCNAPLRPSLAEFWHQVWLKQPRIRDLDSLNISCPCWPGG